MHSLRIACVIILLQLCAAAPAVRHPVCSDDGNGALSTAECARRPAVCVMQEFLTHARCDSLPDETDWPALPHSSKHETPAQAVVRATFETTLRNKVVLFVGDSVNLNLFNFLVCELRRAGMRTTRISADGKDAVLRKAELFADEDVRDAARAFWQHWFSQSWGENGTPSLALDVDVDLVHDTRTTIVRLSMFHVDESKLAAIANMSDMTVLNFGLHYDLVNEQQRARYARHMDAVGTAFARSAAFFRETSRTHVRQAPPYSSWDAAREAGVATCSCAPAVGYDPREWSAELNAMATHALAGRVRFLPFYNLTSDLADGHPATWGTTGGGGDPFCDCTHWCYSPQLVRTLLRGLAPP